MNLISDYWEQIVDVDVLKDKVKTLFELINRKNK